MIMSMMVLMMMMMMMVMMMMMMTAFMLLAHRFKGHKNRDYKVDSCLTSTDAHVVSGSEDGKICFWDLIEAKLVFTLDNAHKGVVYSLSYHPTSVCLLSASSDGTAKVWHEKDWEPE